MYTFLEFLKDSAVVLFILCGMTVKYLSISDRDMQILTYDELIKSINERVTLDWKIIGIYEEEFTPLYKRCCSFATADFLNGNENSYISN